MFCINRSGIISLLGINEAMEKADFPCYFFEKLHLYAKTNRMKYVLTFSFAFISFSFFAQTYELIDRPGSDMMFRECPNRIYLESTYDVKGENCIVHTTDWKGVPLPDGHFDVRVSRLGSAFLHLEDLSGTRVKSFEFRVVGTPDATLFFGSTPDGEVYGPGDMRLHVKFLSPDINTGVKHEVVSWKLTVNDREFVGEGGELSSEAMACIDSNVEYPLMVECWVEEEFTGIRRKRNATFWSK